MSNQPIAAEAIRAVVDAVAELDQKDDAYIAEVLETESWEEHVAEAAIGAADRARGLTVAWRAVSPTDPPVEVSENTARSFVDIPDAEHTLEWRLVGPWVPVGGEAP